MQKNKPLPAPLQAGWKHASEDLIKGLYFGLFNREPDPEGKQYWLSRMRSGESLDDIVECLSQSPEYYQQIEKHGEQQNFENFCHHIVEHAQRLLKETPLTIVDVGAQNLSYETHLYTPFKNWKIPHHIIGFEPIEQGRTAREEEVAAGTLTLFPDFIGDGQNHSFYLNDPDNTSSLLPFNRSVIDHFIHLDSSTTVHIDTVATCTLDQTLKEVQAIDLLKLDIQGFELVALKHAIQALKRTMVIHCEVSFIEMYKGQALLNEVEAFLRQQGFHLIDLVAQCRYGLKGSTFSWSKDWLGWADAIFFRELNNTSLFQNVLSQALTALFIYRKPSLASWLLKQNAPNHEFTTFF